MLFQKKGLRPLGIRQWICVFLTCIFNFLYSNGSGSNESVYHFDILKYDFYYFYGHANFCLCTLYFQYPSTFGNFFALCFTTQVGLQFGTWCPNMSTNINVNFHTPRDCLISYNFMLNQIFIPWTSRKKTSLLFSNVMISQKVKTKKLKF
jgi:hypothetical protein